MTKPTREEVEQWLSVAQSGLIGREYRDVFLKLPDILRGYLAQEEELKEVNDRRKELIAMVDQLQAENKALKAELERSYQAWCASDPQGNPSSLG